MNNSALRWKNRLTAISPDIWMPILLVFLGVIFFADLLFSSKSLYFRDTLNFHFPLHKILIDAYARWELPLWNPSVYLGQPMLANPNYLALYPTNLFHLIAPFNYAFKLHFLIHPLLGGLGLYFLLRRLNLEAIPSLAGALLYQFSGTVLSFLNLHSIVSATALIPWIGWAFQGSLMGHRLRRILLLGFLLALQIISLEPLLFQCCALLILALSILYLLERPDKKTALRVLAVVICSAVLIAAGLSAVQIMPTLELLTHSSRGTGMDYWMSAGWSVHPLDLVSTFIPNFYGIRYTIGSETSWGERFHENRESYIISFFLGSGTLLLAALAIFSSRKQLRNICYAFTGISLLLALGKFAPLYPLLYHHFPLFGLGRYPSKYFLLTTLLMAVLAALGLEAALGGRNNPGQTASGALKCRMQWFLAAILVVGGTILCLGIVGTSRVDSIAEIIRNATPPRYVATKNYEKIAAVLSRSVISSGAFLCLGALILLTRQRLKLSAVAAGIAMLLVVALEIAPANLGLTPLLSSADVDYVPELVQLIKRNGPKEPYRVVTPNYLDPVPKKMRLQAPNASAAWVVLYSRMSGQSIDGIRQGLQYSVDRSIDHLNSRESDALMTRSVELPVPRKLNLSANLNCPFLPVIGPFTDPRLELLGNINTNTELDYRLYRLKDYLPRAYFATKVIPATSHEDALNRFLQSKVLTDTVILESWARPPDGPRGVGVSRVSITNYENNRVVCQVTANDSGYVVLLDSWYPGWKAFLDGRKIDILRANYAFRAVAVAPGSHRLEFVYRPTAFYQGAAITGLTLLIVMAAFVSVGIGRKWSAAK